jgi:hypothetical protein
LHPAGRRGRGGGRGVRRGGGGGGDGRPGVRSQRVSCAGRVAKGIRRLEQQLLPSPLGNMLGDALLSWGIGGCMLYSSGQGRAFGVRLPEDTYVKDFALVCRSSSLQAPFTKTARLPVVCEPVSRNCLHKHCTIAKLITTTDCCKSMRSAPC